MLQWRRTLFISQWMYSSCKALSSAVEALYSDWTVTTQMNAATVNKCVLYYFDAFPHRWLCVSVTVLLNLSFSTTPVTLSQQWIQQYNSVSEGIYIYYNYSTCAILYIRTGLIHSCRGTELLPELWSNIWPCAELVHCFSMHVEQRLYTCQMSCSIVCAVLYCLLLFWIAVCTYALTD